MTDDPNKPAASTNTSPTASPAPAERAERAATHKPAHDDSVLESLGKAISSPIIGTAELDDENLPKPGDKG